MKLNKKKFKRVLFRCDSSSKIGFGHLSRCLTLANELDKLDYDIVFACLNLENNLSEKVLESGFTLSILESNEALFPLLQEAHFDFLILDSYDLGFDFEKRIKAKSDIFLISFDDFYQKHYSNLVINHNITAKDRYFQNSICGYPLIRDEFKKLKLKKRKFSKDVAILMGSSDIKNLNIKLIRALEAYRVKLFTTTANPNLKKLQKFVKTKKNVKLLIEPKNFAKELDSVSFAILTPSVTLNEAIAIKLPSISILVAQNQLEVFKFCKDRRFLTLDLFSKTRLRVVIKKLEKNYQNYQNRLSRFDFKSNKISKKIDNIFLESLDLINFIDLNDAQKREVLEFRNSKKVRKYMLNEDIIKLEDHLRYIEFLKLRGDKRYFLVKSKDLSIGVIDFTKIKNGSCSMGIYANPNLRQVGDILMNRLLDYGFNTLALHTINLQVKKDNLKAIKLYFRCGFTLLSQDGEYLNMQKSR